METKLTRIAQIAKERPNERITAPAGLINKESLMESHKKMSGKKAAGVDQLTKIEYEHDLESNIESLLERMKKQAYKPQPVKRVYIPKAGSDKMRPLGIPAYEDTHISDDEKVMKLIRSEKLITRKTVQEITGLGETQSKALLNRLIDSGFIRRVGKGRMTAYEHIES